jgi:hypothetical protein
MPLRALANAGQGILALAVAFAPLCLGQKVQLVPDIAVAESEYRDANEAWLRNDPDLAKDLFKGDPEDVRRRIHKAAALRDDAMAKKETYLRLVIERLQGARKKLPLAGEELIPTADLKKDLQAQQARVLSEQERVEGLLRDLPQGDENLVARRALNVDRSNLVTLQNDVALRIRSLESIDKAQEAIQATPADALKQPIDNLLNTWEAERAGAVRQRSEWAELYRAMERDLDRKDPAEKASPPTQGGGTKTPTKGKPRRGKDPVPRGTIPPP